jgi:cold shock CspA family protein
MHCRNKFSDSLSSDDNGFPYETMPAINNSDTVLSGRVLFFNEINGTGYIEQDTFAEKLRFSYKHIIKEGYRSLYEGQRIIYGIRKVGTGFKVTFIKGIDLE